MTTGSVVSDSTSSSVLITWLVLIAPTFIASFYPAAFAKALDFAGVFAYCFLCGILPPAKAWIYRSKKRHRSPSSMKDLLPGGNFILAVQFAIDIILGFWH